MNQINADTRFAGILGHPVGHSLSPLIHNTAFTAQGLNCCYVALDVSPKRLRAAVHGLAALGFMGANVTIPHKEAVLPLMDSLSDEARAVGAVNTIVCKEDILHGDNTDIAGFLAPLAGRSLHGDRMIILGAGGAARAVAYGLLKAFAPSRLVLAARRIEQAQTLVADLAPHDSHDALMAVHMNQARTHVRTSTLIINTTPVGMYPGVDVSPWPKGEDFHTGQLVYDLVYRPLRTRLLGSAQRSGADIIGGLEMLLQQAAAAYVQWTGIPMPLVPVRKTLAHTMQ